MSEPLAVPFGEDEFLTLRIAGSPSHSERLLLVARPRGGMVHVREWTTDTWSTEGADFEISSAELLADIERAYDARLAVSEEMYTVRRWLQ